MRPHRLAGVVLLVSITACQPGEDRSGVTETDSAGVRIVDSSTPLWSEGDRWTLSEHPILEIGAVEGGDDDILFGVQDVDRRADGRWVVTASRAHEVRLYSAEGVFERFIGRAGEGPGEFESPFEVWLGSGDSMVVQSFLRRTVFDADGEFVETADAPGTSPQDRFANGSLLFVVVPEGQNGFEPGPLHPVNALVRKSLDGSNVDTLAHVSGMPMFNVASGNGVSRFGQPFAASRIAAALGDSVVTIGGDGFEVRLFDDTGSLRRIMRRSVDPVPVTDAHIEALEARMMDGLPERLRPSRERLFAEWLYPEFVDPVDRLEVDDAGNSWVRAYQTDLPGPALWSVFDRDGRWLGELGLPSDFVVHEIGSDYLAGVWTNALDVQFVRVYALEKG